MVISIPTTKFLVIVTTAIALTASIMTDSALSNHATKRKASEIQPWFVNDTAHVKRPVLKNPFLPKIDPRATQLKLDLYLSEVNRIEKNVTKAVTQKDLKDLYMIRDIPAPELPTDVDLLTWHLPTPEEVSQIVETNPENTTRSLIQRIDLALEESRKMSDEMKINGWEYEMHRRGLVKILQNLSIKTKQYL